MKNIHPVIQSLLNRQGLTVPLNDGKKISLVLYGGLMTGIAGAGAMMALEELGLSNAFDNIFVVSAGLPNASYLLSKQTKLGTSIYYDDLSGRKFINFFKFWNPVQVEKVVEAIGNRKHLNVEIILSSNTKVFVRLFNVETKKAEYFNLNEYCKSNKDYFDILKGAISFPVFSRPVKINNKRYIDGVWGIGRNYVVDHFNFACEQTYTDMLIIYNDKKYELGVSSDKICEITLPWKSSKFETRESNLKQECLKAGLCVKRIFGFDEPIKL